MRVNKWIIFIISLFLVVAITACSGKYNKNIDEGENLEQTNEQPHDDGKVITIKDQTFTYEDIEFQQLMNKVKIALQLEKDLENLNGEDVEERTKYWNEQLSYYDHFNANLQSLIEVYSMSLLAEEKNYFVPKEKLDNLVSEFNEQIVGNKQVEQLIATFGEKEYKYHISEYVRQFTLRDRIAIELEKEIKEDNPDLSNMELNYILSQKYEDLYADQVASLELEIHIQ